MEQLKWHLICRDFYGLDNPDGLWQWLYGSTIMTTTFDSNNNEWKKNCLFLCAPLKYSSPRLSILHFFSVVAVVVVFSVFLYAEHECQRDNN